VLAVTCGTALAATVPGLKGPLSRLANYRADSADPIWDQPGTNGAALRTAAKLLPDDTTYFVWPRDVHDLDGAGFLLFTPAVPVSDPGEARWVLSYRQLPLVPPGVRPVRVRRLAPGIALVEVRRGR